MQLTQQRVEEPLVILGAGLAGLSLADALLARDGRFPIVLIDRRREWDDDRTWCTWLTEPLPAAALAGARWWAWSVTRRGETHVAHTRAHPYIHLRARAVYDDLLRRLHARPSVEIRTGERVREVGDDGRVVTVREAFDAALVIDAMGVHSPLLRHGRTDVGHEGALQQRFLGWEVETERGVFDPDTATLMDLRGGDREGVTFFYVLPFGESHALVEHTTIGRGRGPDAGERRAALGAELTERCGGPGWRVTREEVGAIPMTPRPFPASHGPRVITAGGAAGGVRPSSGYAFTRIQRHCAALADWIIDDGPGRGMRPPAAGPARLATLDATFLAALGTADDGGESLLWSLARRTPADAFARFMTDVGSAIDETRIVAALAPSAPTMLRAVVSSAAAARRRRP